MHVKRKGLVLFVLALILVATTCVGQEGTISISTPEPTETMAPTRTSPPQHIAVSGPACPQAFQEQDQVRRNVQIDTGSVLTLTLGATPSIPCWWESPEIGDAAILQQVDRQSVWPAEGATPQPGAPGAEIWLFEPRQAGESVVSLTCTCLGEEGSDEEVTGTFLLNAVVQ